MNRTALTVAALAGVAAIYHVVLGRAHMAEIRALERQFGDAYARYEEAERQSQRTAELQACVLELERWRDDLGARTTAAQPQLPLPATTTALTGRGLTLERAELLPADAALPLSHDRVRVVVSGSFADVYRAIHELENASPQARVSDLLLRGRAGTSALSGDLTIVRAGGVR